MKFWTMKETLRTFQRPYQIVYVTFRSEDIRHYVSKSSKNQTNVKISWPQFFLGGNDPTVLQQIVITIYHPPFGKVWLSSMCWSPSAKPGNDVESGIHRVGKNGGPVWSRLWTKVQDILRRSRRPLVVVNAVDRLSISCFVPKIQAVKVAIKLRSRPKRWLLGPRFVGEGIPQILNMCFQIAVTSEHVADFGWVPFSELGD